jgi:hypothetical protein
MPSGIQIRPFGGNGGDEFPMAAIKSIGLRAGEEIDQIRINGKSHGRNNGSDRGSIVLAGDEYITKVEIRSGLRVDYLRFTTNNGSVIGGGGGAATLDKIRVIAIGGRSGDRVDKLNIMYVNDYRPSSIEERNASFILSCAAPFQELEEYESSRTKIAYSYQKVTESMLRQQYSPSIAAEYLVKVAIAAEIELKNASMDTVKRELEHEVAGARKKKVTINDGFVGIQLASGTLMKGADGAFWMYPTSEPSFSVIKLDQVNNVLGYYDLTGGQLATQMPGLQDHRTMRNGYVYYARPPA